MVRCNNCGTANLDGSEYCDECGMKLVLTQWPPASSARGNSAPPIYQPPSANNQFSVVDPDPRPSGGATNERRGFAPDAASRGNGEAREDGSTITTEDAPPIATSEGPLPSPPAFTTSTSIPRAARPATDPRPPERAAERRLPEPRLPEAGGPGQTLVLSSRGKTDALVSNRGGVGPGNLGLASKLVIERGGRVGKEFSITSVETHIGRWDADSGIFPDVDLDQDDPEAKVSRRHARILNQNGQYFIEDLGSTNGTFINRGRRLLPGHRQMLQSGDEIIVGKTFLKFQIIR